jgi:hypothetical protein
MKRDLCSEVRAASANRMQSAALLRIWTKVSKCASISLDMGTVRTLYPRNESRSRAEAAVIATVTAGGSAVAQSLVEQVPAVPRESLPNRYEPPFSETDFQLGDHQQLRGYFLSGPRDRVR